MLGSNWPESYSRPDGGEFSHDLRLFEVHRASARVAWQAKVYGNASATRTAGKFEGWLAYSVERFYDAPLVWELRCAAGGISFAAASAMKMNNLSPARFSLRLKATREVLVDGAFELLAHWRSTRINATASASASARLAGASAELEVTDVWGSVRTKEVFCAGTMSPNAEN